MICDDVLDLLSEKIDEMEAGRLAIINKLIALDSWDNPSIKTYTLTEIPDHILLIKYTVNFFDYYGNILKTLQVFKGQGAEPPTDIEKEIVIGDKTYFFNKWIEPYENILRDTNVHPQYDPYYEIRYYFQSLREVLYKKTLHKKNDKITSFIDLPSHLYYTVKGFNRKPSDISPITEDQEIIILESANLIIVTEIKNIFKYDKFPHGLSVIGYNFTNPDSIETSSIQYSSNGTVWTNESERLTAANSFKDIWYKIEANNYPTLLKKDILTILEKEIFTISLKYRNYNETNILTVNSNVEYGENLTPIDVPATISSTFTSWDHPENFNNVIENREVNALYKPTEFKVKFSKKTDTITFIETKTCYYGQSIIPPEVSLSGWRFIEWQDQYGERVDTASRLARVDLNYDLYAFLRKETDVNIYRVYGAYNELVYTFEKMLSGDAIDEETVKSHIITPSGYDFDKWNPTPINKKWEIGKETLNISAIFKINKLIIATITHDGNGKAIVSVSDPSSGASVYYKTSISGSWISGNYYQATNTITVYFKIEATGYLPKGNDNTFGMNLTKTTSPGYVVISTFDNQALSNIDITPEQDGYTKGYNSSTKWYTSYYMKSLDCGHYMCYVSGGTSTYKQDAVVKWTGTLI